MRLKFCIFILSITGFFFIFSDKSFSIVDPLSSQNNKFGIHILYPEEIDKASDLVNSSGGDWGYVTIPIRADDRYKEKWQKFFDKCSELHLIPILRLASYPRKNYWMKPSDLMLLDFANFLSELRWPTKNKYVIFFNEPNYALEWGGKVEPEEYAKILILGAKIFKEKDLDFFILPAGLDAAAPNDVLHKDLYSFLREMFVSQPEVFNYIDGWVSHSYPNPGFTAKPTDNHQKSIVSYRHEINFLKKLKAGKEIPVFVTETGWKINERQEDVKAKYFKIAFNEIWTDDFLVAVTPFLLFAGDGDFINFSLIKKDGSLSKSYLEIKNLSKFSGNPSAEKPVVLGVKTETFKSDLIKSVDNESFINKIRSSRFKVFLNSFKKLLARKEG
jgi:hypothetical protein